MKKHIFSTIGAIFTLVLVLVVATSNTQAADKNTKTVECKISVDVQSFYDKDMIETQLKKHDGVTDAYVELEEKIAYVTYDKTKTNSENICKVIKGMGFEAKLIEEKDKNFGLN